VGGTIIPVEPQVFDVLVYLIENRDRVVSKDDLIASVGGGRIVSESTLTSRINAWRSPGLRRRRSAARRRQE
jgi:DNA-binding winged helix-turn-helix (wHTH) protein